MSIKKSSLQQAFLEAKEIEKAAYESAKKVLEETLAPQIDKAVRESLNSINVEKSETLEEEVNINIAPGAELNVDVKEDGTATVSVGENSSEISDEMSDDESLNNIESNIESMETEDINNEDIFEVEDMNEVDAAAPAPTEIPAEAPVEAPVEEVPLEEIPAEEAPAEDGIEASLEQINKKLDALIADEASEEASLEGGPEGEIEIVDDETASAEAPVETAIEDAVNEMDSMEEVMDDEEIVYEIEDDVKDSFDSMDELEEIEITDELEEIEIIDDEEMMDEAGDMNLSFTAQKQANQRDKDRKGHHAPINVNENKEKAQKESATDELKQENASLKETIKEYKESFIVLRKQINEIQTFNAKLAYANKLFTNGGITNSEKIRIAEEFDKVETIEESKKLYNKLLSEFNSSKTAKPSVDKLKSVKPAVITSTQTPKPLYESEESKRMKKLAGIIS